MIKRGDKANKYTGYVQMDRGGHWAGKTRYFMLLKMRKYDSPPAVRN